jgi:hypothetical protein
MTASWRWQIRMEWAEVQLRLTWDSIAEISYILANAPAEFKSPVNFTTVTKSGTNQLHGSAYYDFNGSALNARNFFSNTVPFRVYNNYAVSAGGPIRKNKTFFFGDFEDSSNHLGMQAARF